ncbi:MAG: SRPBCC family protein [Endomicrobiales bacterium]
MRQNMYGRIAVSICAVIVLCGSAFAQVDITVSRERGAYRIQAEFSAEAAEDTVRSVLADYENIPRFVSSVSESRITERGDGYIVLEQKGKENVLLLFSKEIHLLLKVREERNRISFEDLLRKDFSVYDGSWEFAQAGEVTRITYSLVARPAFFVPGFMGKEFFRTKGKRFCEEILAEIRRRAQDQASPAAAFPGS